MTTLPLDTTRNPRLRHHIRAALAGLALLGVGLSAQAGVGHGGIDVRTPFTNVKVGHHHNSRDNRYGNHGKRDDRRHYGHRYDRDNRSHGHHDRHDNRRYSARNHRDRRYDRRYADQHGYRHHDRNRGGLFGRW